MSIRKSAAFLSAVLLIATLANAASRNEMMRITVLDSTTKAMPLNDNGVPKNCDQATFDAYCRSTQTAPLVNTLLVQEGNDPPFRVSCTIESRYSRCQPLPRGATYDARREKRGVTIYYIDDKGKPRKEFYTLAETDKKLSSTEAPRSGSRATTGPANPPASVAVATSNSVPAPPEPAVSAVRSPTVAVQQAQSSAPPGPGWVQVASPEKVRCTFNSTPVGAEISVDGKYVGNTPSQIALPTGAHRVVFSIAGFASWTRDLTVMAGSEISVSPVLQKETR
jgi:hypothetical protein